MNKLSAAHVTRKHITRLLFPACVLFVAAPLSSYADTTEFSGFSVGGNLQLSSDTLQVNNWINPVFGAGIGTLNGSAGTQRSAAVDAAYEFPLTSSIGLNVGVSADLGSTNVLSDPNGAFVGAPFKNITQNNHYSIYIEPGLMTGAATQVYAKLAYHSMNLNDPNAQKSIQSQNFNGYGLGAGIRTKLSKNWAMLVEVEQVTYAGKNDSVVNAGSGNTTIANVKPSSTIASIGVQYYFGN